VSFLISGTSGHGSITTVVGFDWQGMTCYWCSIMTFCLGGTLSSYKPLKISRYIIPNKKKLRPKYRYSRFQYATQLKKLQIKY